MITFITGNPGKLEELRRIFPAHMELTHQALELDEIQSLDMHEIVAHKLRQAYARVGGPVMVEDVSAELDSLNGLPGPFVKFFMKRMGDDALYKIGAVDDSVRIVCTMGYYNGRQEIIVDGIMTGTVVAPRGEDGFGFDPTIVPDGYTQTIAELGTDVKDTISHRRKACDAMGKSLRQIL
ncbi:MAG: non-canonical purine NTP pyrophosphatase [Candidatus Saccharimonadales bacterium]